MPETQKDNLPSHNPGQPEDAGDVRKRSRKGRVIGAVSAVTLAATGIGATVNALGSDDGGAKGGTEVSRTINPHDEALQALEKAQPKDFVECNVNLATIGPKMEFKDKNTGEVHAYPTIRVGYNAKDGSLPSGNPYAGEGGSQGEVIRWEEHMNATTTPKGTNVAIPTPAFNRHDSHIPNPRINRGEDLTAFIPVMDPTGRGQVTIDFGAEIHNRHMQSDAENPQDKGIGFVSPCGSFDVEVAQDGNIRIMEERGSDGTPIDTSEYQAP